MIDLVPAQPGTRCVLARQKGGAWGRELHPVIAWRARHDEPPRPVVHGTMPEDVRQFWVATVWPDGSVSMPGVAELWASESVWWADWLRQIHAVERGSGC